MYQRYVLHQSHSNHISQVLRLVSTESENPPVCLSLAFRWQCIRGVFTYSRYINVHLFIYLFTYLLTYLLTSLVPRFLTLFSSLPSSMTLPIRDQNSMASNTSRHFLAYIIADFCQTCDEIDTGDKAISLRQCVTDLHRMRRCGRRMLLVLLLLLVMMMTTMILICRCDVLRIFVVGAAVQHMEVSLDTGRMLSVFVYTTVDHSSCRGTGNNGK